MQDFTYAAHLALDDERRRYYRMAELGQLVVRAEARRLENAARAARAKRLLPRKS